MQICPELDEEQRPTRIVEGKPNEGPINVRERGAAFLKGLVLDRDSGDGVSGALWAELSLCMVVMQA